MNREEQIAHRGGVYNHLEVVKTLNRCWCGCECPGHFQRLLCAAYHSKNPEVVRRLLAAAVRVKPCETPTYKVY
jgi:hypothetical protein